MLRSFNYAAYAGLFGQAATRPADFGRLEPWAHIWQTWASAAFLRGYFEPAGEASFLPADFAQRDALLVSSCWTKATQLRAEQSSRLGPDPALGYFQSALT